MSNLGQLGKPPETQLREELEENGKLEKTVDQHRSKFEDRFEDNQHKEVPTHPFNIYREIVSEQDLEVKEKLVLEELKEEYAEKWLDQKKKHRQKQQRLDQVIS